MYYNYENDTMILWKNKCYKQTIAHYKYVYKPLETKWMVVRNQIDSHASASQTQREHKETLGLSLILKISARVIYFFFFFFRIPSIENNWLIDWLDRLNRWTELYILWACRFVLLLIILAESPGGPQSTEVNGVSVVNY